jgi:hypothetical protein
MGKQWYLQRPITTNPSLTKPRLFLITKVMFFLHFLPEYFQFENIQSVPRTVALISTDANACARALACACLYSLQSKHKPKQFFNDCASFFSTCEDSRKPTNNANKIIRSIFLIMKVTILDTHCVIKFETGFGQLGFDVALISIVLGVRQSNANSGKMKGRILDHI